MTTHTAASEKFYCDVFGYTARHNVASDFTYTEFVLVDGEKPVGGMLGMKPGMEGVPSYWVVYFAVENCDTTIGIAAAKGAVVHYGAGTCARGGQNWCTVGCARSPVWHRRRLALANQTISRCIYGLENVQ